MQGGLARRVTGVLLAVLFAALLAACAGLAPSPAELPPSSAGLPPPPIGRTVPESSGVNLVAVGDIAYCRRTPALQSAAARTVQLAREMLGADPRSRVLTLGDNVYEIGSAAEFRDCYEPTWGALKPQTWPLPGNHDYGVPHAQPYYAYFGAAAGDPGKGYYQRSLNGWTVITLNSNIAGEPGSPQYRWLDQALQEAPGPCIIAAWHHPRFTSAPRGPNLQTAALFDRLVAGRVTLLLQGHEHHYERLAPLQGDGRISESDGMTSMVVGTGGAPLSGFLPTLLLASRFQLRQHGVLRLQLEPGRLRWAFVDLERQVQDSGELACRGKP